jgi:chromate transporter
MILLQIVLSFMKVAVLAFGGAYAAFPLVEQEIVINRAWMTYTEFLDLVALDEITPGPIIVNCATFVGMKVAGIPGAIAASIGCSLPSILIVSLLIFFYQKYKSLPMMKEVLKALKCMAAALILTSFVKMFGNIILPNGFPDISIYALVMAVLSYVLMHKFKFNPLLVMLGCGAVNLILYLIK